ncbi:coiled-coil domain-containing protein 102A isoform X2 [Anthonomus grandis grandis]|uniref:coiled-coil domain-containing protein 102A isoform X2 n=1 Tax=Anthonomus grandis grandis TaxID=2921223 RepID=UPI0021653E10|nr:coiled-coil domain-containing protein 102A isoform X2 [Anthonomus grandis grandis]
MAQSSTSGTSSRKHTRDHDSASVSSRIGDVSEWEANEALRQRELEEAKGRAAQMEKTMRWWSDCTANWREKWSKVRNERNKAREECKQLRTKLEVSVKEASTYKRSKEDLESQNEQLKKEIEKIHLLLLKHAGQFDSQIFEALGEDPLKDFAFSNGSPTKDVTGINSPLRDLLSDCERQNGVSSSQSNPECDSTGHLDLELKDRDTDINLRLENDLESLRGAIPKQRITIKAPLAVDDDMIHKMSMLQLKLEEATKTIGIEREEKDSLQRLLDRINNELHEEKEKCDELRDAKQDAMRQLLNLQDDHEKEIQLIKADLLDEASNREGTDKKLNDLRAELERLQAENASEWAKRERLETEKLALERDNKKLRSEIRDMQDRLERKSNRTLSTSDMEIRHLQQEICDRNKEIADLRHSQSKLKKIVQDKMTELAHATRRAEQYESEVKKLRTRVEELKKDLAIAEDELDTVQNHSRKLQRTNDELQEQVDNFQVQLQHLHTSMEKEDGGEEMAVFDEETDCIT